MTKVTMPEPAIQIYFDENADTAIFAKGSDEAIATLTVFGESVCDVGQGFLTPDQAEAYADAKVREALECVSREVHNVLHPTNPREDWTQYAYIREEAAHDAESAIRALIPQHDNE